MKIVIAALDLVGRGILKAGCLLVIACILVILALVLLVVLASL